MFLIFFLGPILLDALHGFGCYVDGFLPSGLPRRYSAAISSSACVYSFDGNQEENSSFFGPISRTKRFRLCSERDFSDCQL
ncbi:hypothetical protein M758_N011500 [Ceratodon purpureus]|nr:hypothetical protein M758_N011500 [Ceratodon purpureus]